MPASHESRVLLIVGPDDGELSYLKEYSRTLGVGNRVHFLEPLYGADRLAAFVDADVLASPATNEVFGLVPFEALMCGTPVVVAREAGQGQLIELAGAGDLVPFGDADALAESIHCILEHQAAANEKINAGQQFIRNHLDAKIKAKDLADYYAEVVKNRNES